MHDPKFVTSIVKYTDANVISSAIAGKSKGRYSTPVDLPVKRTYSGSSADTEPCIKKV